MEYRTQRQLDSTRLGQIECRDVRKAYHSTDDGSEVPALGGFEIDIEPGEFLTLLGASGCGKSTLLNILAGFEQPDEGSVSVDGRLVTCPGPDRGVVFQDYALFPWLTVEQNIVYGLREMGLPKAQIDETGRRYVRMVGLSGFERRYPHELSGGMRQRVALARVLAIDCKILLRVI